MNQKSAFHFLAYSYTFANVCADYIYIRKDHLIIFLGESIKFVINIKTSYIYEKNPLHFMLFNPIVVQYVV